MVAFCCILARNNSECGYDCSGKLHRMMDRQNYCIASQLQLTVKIIKYLEEFLQHYTSHQISTLLLYAWKDFSSYLDIQKKILV